MDFNYTEEQLALQDTLRRYLAKDYGFEQRRALAKSAEGYSRTHWRQFADLGILALPFPEEFGGITVDGGNAVDNMLVMEMFGRSLVLEPYLTTVILCGGLIRDAGSQKQKKQILPAIGGGELLMALAHYEAQGRYQPSHVASTAQPDGGGFIINGAKAVVLGGGAAGKLIVSARTSGGTNDSNGISLFIVAHDAPGVTLRSYATQDGARAAEVKLTDVRVAKDALIGTQDAALPLIQRALDYAVAALCAEAVGAMTALNEATLEYIKTRKQFGQPIGRFQTLQHRMVDMLMATEQARSMTILAAVRVDANDPNDPNDANDANVTIARRRAISAAKAYVGQSARSVGQSAVQLHGGMGVVDELNVSHYFKRLTMINATFGDADYHLGCFSDSLLAA
ncbi:MAG: acyl-CoA dehydrogenase family protein [Betaproteobacteria bacterium]|nr:acyl-CoA dehydrogenase family protein [Betaproteobacteria bacterium]